MQINPDTNAITVHGRESLMLPYTRFSNDEPREQQDISAATMFIEIPGAGIRKQLVPNSADAKGLLILLTRAEVERIPTTPSAYILLDETDEDHPILELSGDITRTGYKGEPVAPAPRI